LDCKAELVHAIHDVLAFGDTKVISRVGLAEIRDVLRHDQNVVLCRDYVAVVDGAVRCSLVREEVPVQDEKIVPIRRDPKLVAEEAQEIMLPDYESFSVNNIDSRSRLPKR